MGAKKQRCSGKFAIALATEFLAGYSKTTDLLPGERSFREKGRAIAWAAAEQPVLAHRKP